MGKLIDLLSALFVYFCIATVLTTGVIVGVLCQQGYLQAEKVVEILAVMHGLPPQSGSGGESGNVTNQPSKIQPIEKIKREHRLQSLDLALREQAVEKGLRRIDAIREEVKGASKRYEIKRTALLNRIGQMELEAQQDALLHTRAALENMKPAQQKMMIEKMIDTAPNQGLEDAVAIIRAMPAELQRKLHVEFKTDRPQDNETLFKILREIRSGKPTASFFEATRKEFEVPKRT